MKEQSTTKLKELIMQKEFEKWAKNNQTLIHDVTDLFQQMMMFEVKYGIHIDYSFAKMETPKGRSLGKI